MVVKTSSPSVFEPGARLTDGSRLNAAESLPQVSTTSGLVATGTTVTDALQLRTAINQLATVDASTGVKLGNLIPGQWQDVYNDGANPVKVYSAFATIDGTAGATGVTLTNALRCRFTCVAPGVVLSAQLGAVSS